jgi:hypothetical protein
MLSNLLYWTSAVNVRTLQSYTLKQVVNEWIQKVYIADNQVI